MPNKRMWKLSIMVLILFIGLVDGLSAQELRVTNVQDNGTYHGEAKWPMYGTARDQWDSLFSKYNLVRVESDPFGSNSLAGTIARLANKATLQGNGYAPDFKAYTIYLALGNRRFICLIAYRVGNIDDYWTWVYEVK